MKALLINPKYPVSFWSFNYALRFVSKKAACPPLGLLTVASMLPGDWDLRLSDMNVNSLNNRDLEWADLVMVTGMIVQKESALDVLNRCRTLGKKVVVGGPLFSSNPSEYMDLVDHLVLNEAELTLPLFLEDLDQGRAKKVYETNEFPDISSSPVPRWDLIDPRQYQTLLLQGSRGCPHNCEFCDITSLFGREPRVKLLDGFLAELDAIYELGWRGPVFFVDDNFIGNKRKIKPILHELINWMKDRDYPYSFTTEASINLADDEELTALMVEAGFDTVFVGIETPNEDSLMECGKKQNCRRDLLAAIKKLQAAGLQVMGGYIVGFDNDDESIFSKQIKFIQESGVVAAMVGILNAAPKTRLWNRLKEEGRLVDSTTGDNTDGTINFIPAMGREKLLEGYSRIVKTIYTPRFFYQRVSRFLEHFQPKRKKKMQGWEVKAFLKSIFLLGILGNGASQWYFWKLFFKSIIRYPSAFSEAMTMMVYGYHFRKVAKSVCVGSHLN